MRQCEGKKQSVPLATVELHVGEMDVEETEETLTDPVNRIIKQISVDDIDTTNKMFNDLMGDAVVPRKKYIKEHSAEATYNAE